MQQAREANKDNTPADMLCLLVYWFGIDDDKVLDMPYQRSEVMLEWFATMMKEQNKGGGGGFGKGKKSLFSK
jgi:hypothetical protein